MRTEELYLRDIVEAAKDISEFIEELNLESFQQSKVVQRAVVQCLSTIGEAANRVSAELRARHPKVPWAELVAFRNILVHAYFGIRVDRIWDAATSEVPLLRSQVEEILRNEFALEDL
jgi:uncharacterized protein with HEPN domain